MVKFCVFFRYMGGGASHQIWIQCAKGLMEISLLLKEQPLISEEYKDGEEIGNISKSNNY